MDLLHHKGRVTVTMRRRCNGDDDDLLRPAKPRGHWYGIYIDPSYFLDYGLHRALTLSFFLACVFLSIGALLCLSDPCVLVRGSKSS